jgi:hypothetical protein
MASVSFNLHSLGFSDVPARILPESGDIFPTQQKNE